MPQLKKQQDPNIKLGSLNVLELIIDGVIATLLYGNVFRLNVYFYSVVIYSFYSPHN